MVKLRNGKGSVVKVFSEQMKHPQGFMGKMTLLLMKKNAAPVNNWAAKYIPTQSTNKALDLGCGCGLQTQRLLSNCRKGFVTAIDSSSLACEFTQSQIQNEADLARCKVLHTGLKDANFSDESFNVVTAFDSMYFWDSAEDTIEEIFRVTSPNGIVAICNTYTDAAESTNPWAEDEQVRIYGEYEIVDLLEAAGYKDVVIYNNFKKPWICVVGRKPKPKPKPKARPRPKPKAGAAAIKSTGDPEKDKERAERIAKAMAAKAARDKAKQKGEQLTPEEQAKLKEREERIAKAMAAKAARDKAKQEAAKVQEGKANEEKPIENKNE